MRTTARTILPLAVALATAVPGFGQEPADLIVVSGNVVTMDEAAPRVEAFAVKNGAVVALGTTREIEARYAAPDVLDLKGRTVLPGLIDAHGHVMGLGRALRSLDLVGTESAEAIAALVADAAASRPPGGWITGRGWDQNDWLAKAFPTHGVLDRAAPEHPVWLTRVDGHAGWANARAMELAGITRDTPDPDGGRIERDEDGEPTGVFVDNAQALMAEAIPTPDDAEREARLGAAQARILEVGLTGVHDMGVNLAELEVYRRWADEGRLAFRAVVYLGADRETLDWWDAGEWTAPPTDHPHLVVRGLKMYADGALGSRGAALLAPYSDDPGNTGLLVTRPDSLRALVSRAFAKGLQPAIHAIGDRGNQVALDAYEAGLPAAGPDPRPRVEHAQVVALEDIPRFGALGAVASVQPTHATSDMYWAEDRVGPERIRGAYAWRRLREAGAMMACGSDFPVESANPFYGLYAAVTRQDQKGWPEGGWRPEERMTREEALRCFTMDAAHAAFLEAEVGSLSPGKRADFVVLDRDYFAVPAEEIWRIRVLRTVVDGETVYEAPAEGEP